MSLPPLNLATVATFKDLDPSAIAELEARLRPIDVARDACIVREGAPADALYVVVSGRFAVEVEAEPDPVAEIGHGATIGEIAFFAGGARTATVRAIRDSVVVRLTREDFDELAARAPAIWRSVTATLANRLAAQTKQASKLRSSAHTSRATPPPRTIAIIAAGARPIPDAFIAALQAFAAAAPGSRVLEASDARALLNGAGPVGQSATQTLNDLEARHERILFIADRDLTPWSEKAIRHADEILLVATPLDDPVGSPVSLNPVETFALKFHRGASVRLVLIHARKGVVQGTRHWLAAREPAMHHHVALSDAPSLARLWRFLSGTALGYVACGGGALTAAHIGIYKALRESGVELDLIGGTSGGAAMAAAFAQDFEPESIDAAVHRMFIDGRALQRYTLPRYSLIDHTHFDAHLEAEYGNGRIEDLWKPYFAVSADLSRYDLEVHRSGSIWQAVRASAAIPGLLPPFYTSDGRMLVDGSVIANVPIETMHALKRGPNIVVSFRAPESQTFTVDYAALPARRDLVWRTLNPLRRGDLPRAPSAATVLVRSLMANRTHFERHMEPSDLLFVPPTPADMGALDWRQHSTLVDTACRYAREEITRRLENANATQAIGALHSWLPRTAGQMSRVQGAPTGATMQKPPTSGEIPDGSDG